MFDPAALQFMDIDAQRVAFRTMGSGPPVLLLHGFPQTHAMWHEVAPALANDFAVVVSDLRGYGNSAKPKAEDAYTFRNMATDQLRLMQALGHKQFHIVGHDRGGRVAHRLALDFPDSVISLTVMDIVPTHHLLSTLNKDVATAYYHWFFLPQPFPFPETLIRRDPDAFFESCLLGWGAAKITDFAPQALAAYRAAWRDPETIRGMCADYRAAIRYDFDIDTRDLGRSVACPSLVLYGADGAMARAYNVPETWADRLSRMQAQAIPGGHFFIDQHPSETTLVLRRFLGAV